MSRKDRAERRESKGQAERGAERSDQRGQRGEVRRDRSTEARKGGFRDRCFHCAARSALVERAS